MKTSPITLEALNKKVKKLIKDGLDSYWVIAEISELKVNYSGHCYLELVQNNDKNDHLVARARGVIWSNTFRMLKPYFETTTGQKFTEGIKVMVRVVVEFHEVYGLSLTILDIEPTYTVGELAIRKQKILEKLTAEGVIDMNKELELPYLLNRIAVISSKTAAGWGDFENQLVNNPQGFKFYYKLFPASMQGNESEGSIIKQLDIIFQNSHLFDTVVIIRGGGASADLECFNSYWLAYNITQFPLPVLTGIGHEQDDSVVDLVANTRLKTPTAVADFILERMLEVENELFSVQTAISQTAKSIIHDKKQSLNNSAYNLQSLYNNRVKEENKKISKLSLDYISAVKNKIYRNQKYLVKNSSKLHAASLRLLINQSSQIENRTISLDSSYRLLLTKFKHNIDKSEQYIQQTNPKNILKKGYSISIKDGKSIKDGNTLAKGDSIETYFYKGKKKSIVK